MVSTRCRHKTSLNRQCCWNRIEDGDITLELRPRLEEGRAHGPCVDVGDTLCKGMGERILIRFGIVRVAVAELEGPQYAEAEVKELPETIRAVAVLVEDETFANARPRYDQYLHLLTL